MTFKNEYLVRLLAKKEQIEYNKKRSEDSTKNVLSFL